MTNAKTGTVGYFDFGKGKFVLYGSKEDVKKRQAKPKAPRQKSPLHDIKAYAREHGNTFKFMGTYMKVVIGDKTLIVDTEEPFFAENQLMAYVQQGDLDPFTEIAPNVYLDTDFIDIADELLALFEIAQAPAINA